MTSILNTIIKIFITILDIVELYRLLLKLIKISFALIDKCISFSPKNEYKLAAERSEAASNHLKNHDTGGGGGTRTHKRFFKPLWLSKPLPNH